MSVRRTLTDNPAMTTSVTIGLVVIALAFTIYQLLPPPGPWTASAAWFTTDNGQTWFKDKASLIPLIRKDGQSADRAYVFRCGDGKPFVGYLERWAPEARKQLDVLQANDQIDRRALHELAMRFKQVKRPADLSWTRSGDSPSALRITDVRCPDGTLNGLVSVYPD